MRCIFLLLPAAPPIGGDLMQYSGCRCCNQTWGFCTHRDVDRELTINMVLSVACSSLPD